ncbi:unnamed protein product [Adineta ricciae]|uniref:F-box domain-containing protein n=1 Tax=Adineta ricciae TaxID=249248 RepID=A0A814WZY0_ADIRI|nr:unnamed protein product [Adineta ricciae]CAF1208860.1 unnamed protein product [Adineta ricciae]
MSEKTSLTLLDHLPTEILFDIFDYLSCNDILYGFYNLNEKFNRILLEHYPHLNSLETPNNDFNFWQTILPIIQLRVEHVTITSIDSGLTLNAFPNLKSLVISTAVPIYSDELKPIIEDEKIRQLTTLKLRSEILSRADLNETSYIIPTIFHHANSIETFEFLSTFDLHRLKNVINVTIQSLTVKLGNSTSILTLITHTPNLRYLNAVLYPMSTHPRPEQTVNLTHVQLRTLLITSENGSIKNQSFARLSNIIKQFSTSLVRLSLKLSSIISTDTQFDGHILRNQLLNPMTKLKNFHLFVTFDEEPTETSTLLSTFQNQFWYNHRWAVGVYGKHLFTLPFHFKELNCFTDVDEIKSSNSKMLSTWPYVTLIDLSQCNNLDVNLIKQLKTNMPNLTTLILSAESMNNLVIDETVTLDNVSTIHCKGEYLQNIKQWLVKVVPNTKRLVLSYRPQSATSSLNRTVYLHKLDAYFRGPQTIRNYTYFLNIQHVDVKFTVDDAEDVHRHVLRLIREFFEMFKNLNSFTFEFHQNIFDMNNIPFRDPDELFKLLNMDRISQKYRLKRVDNYIQFIKKTRV